MRNNKIGKRNKIKRRIRGRILGTNEKPRLSVFRSNKDIFAQMINDIDGITLVSASSLSSEMRDSKVTKLEKANIVGKSIAEKCKLKGIKKCAFDRNGYLYHGRVKSLAEGAREGGLEF